MFCHGGCFQRSSSYDTVPACTHRKRPFLIRPLENTLIKLLKSLDFYDDEGRIKIAIGAPIDILTAQPLCSLYILSAGHPTMFHAVSQHWGSMQRCSASNSTAPPPGKSARLSSRVCKGRLQSTSQLLWSVLQTQAHAFHFEPEAVYWAARSDGSVLCDEAGRAAGPCAAADAERPHGSQGPHPTVRNGVLLRLPLHREH